jgi:hypothetical protein
MLRPGACELASVTFRRKQSSSHRIRTCDLSVKVCTWRPIRDASCRFGPNPSELDERAPRTNQYLPPDDRKVQDTLNTVGRTISPTFNLCIGWLL